MGWSAPVLARGAFKGGCGTQKRGGSAKAVTPRACVWKGAGGAGVLELVGMYHHIKQLMYTVRIGVPDPRFGNMLLEQFGGANG
jgi:hypothetical protein